MKIKVLVMAAALAVWPASAQVSDIERHGAIISPPRPPNPEIKAKPTSTIWYDPSTYDEWRIVDSETNEVWTTEGWYSVSGKVIQSQGGALLIDAWIRQAPGKDSTGWCLLKNYPVLMADDDRISHDLPARAKYVGLTTYTTVLGAPKTVRSFDYGIPTPTPQHILLARIAKQRRATEAAERATAEHLAKVVSGQRQRAEEGNAVAQCLLGKRYLKGDGVVKDLSLARHWLEKAAAQGDSEAKAALATLEK